MLASSFVQSQKGDASLSLAHRVRKLVPALNSSDPAHSAVGRPFVIVFTRSAERCLTITKYDHCDPPQLYGITFILGRFMNWDSKFGLYKSSPSIPSLKKTRKNNCNTCQPIF